jgi:hypothetical protein
MLEKIEEKNETEYEYLAKEVNGIWHLDKLRVVPVRI